MTYDTKPCCDMCEATGANREQERIIKLLEEMAKSTFPGDVWIINPFEYAISMLKNSGHTEDAS